MRTLLPGLVLLSFAWDVPMASAVDDTYEAVLIEFGIAPDHDGIAQFLGSLHPTADARAQVAKLIDQLGDDTYAVREKASRQLQMLPFVPEEELRKAVEGSDPEVRWRAKEILDEAGSKYAAVLFATLKTIERQEIGELTTELLATIPLCNHEEYLLRAAREALQASAGADDIQRLRDALRSDYLETRIAATAALGSLLGVAAADDVRPLLSDAEERVRLAAGRTLANLGDRGCLDTLCNLMTSEDLRVRAQAAQVLRALTGQSISFTPYEETAERQKSVDAWREWIAKNGPTAELKFPIKDSQVELGRTIICFHGQNMVLELDSAGKQTWDVRDIPNPWACQGLSNGHRLVASYGARLVVEYDAEGKEIWRAANLPGQPFSVERLDNGNTLLACSDSMKVVEVNREGKVVWEVTLAGRPMDARRLPDGNTLVALQQANRVVEVDHQGKEVWKLEGVNNPLSAQRLENGNTVICEMSGGRVVEHDRSGKLVWTRAGFANPYDAQRLSNGNTLISHNTGVMEVDPMGKMVWEYKGQNISRISRY